VPADYYEASDLIGLIYHNPLTHGRIGLYPPFLRLGEKTEYQRLGDNEFAKQLVERQPFGAIANDERVRVFWNNPDNLKALWALVEPDREDLVKFIRTGKSAKYDEQPILGKWSFDTRAAMLTLRRAKPNLTTSQLKAIRLLFPQLDQATLVASPDGKVTIHGLAKLGNVKPAAAAAAGAPAEAPMVANARGADRLSGFRSRTGTGPRVTPAPVVQAAAPASVAGGGVPSVETYNLEGEWHKVADGYELVAGDEKMEAIVDGIRLTIGHEPTPFVFEKEVP